MKIEFPCHYWLIIPLVFGFLVSCNDDSELPNEPVINEIEFKTATNELTLKFTDGDGNFGLADRDTFPPFQFYLDTLAEIPNPYYYNYWLDVFIKREGAFVPLETPGTFDFRVPVLTPQGQNKQLRVTITNDLDFDLRSLVASGDVDLEYGDTLKFQVVLVDRDLNESEIAETSEVVLEE